MMMTSTAHDPTSAAPMISVIGLHKSFGDKKVLRGIEIDVLRGDASLRRDMTGVVLEAG